MYLTIFAPTMAMVIGTVEWMGREVPYLTYVIPGIMAMSAVSVGNAAAINIYIDRLSGEMEIMFSLPIRRVAILAGYAANAVVRSLVSSMGFSCDSSHGDTVGVHRESVGAFQAWWQSLPSPPSDGRCSEPPSRSASGGRAPTT